VQCSSSGNWIVSCCPEIGCLSACVFALEIPGKYKMTDIDICHFICHTGGITLIRSH
jgi:hypothetical protein